LFAGFFFVTSGLGSRWSGSFLVFRLIGVSVCHVVFVGAGMGVVFVILFFGLGFVGGVLAVSVG